jgi:small-conductance mechanosensitive channel
MDDRMDTMITRPTLAGVGVGAAAVAERHRRDEQVRRRTQWVVRSVLALATAVLVVPRVTELSGTAELVLELATVPAALLGFMAFTLAVALRLGSAISDSQGPVTRMPAPAPAPTPAPVADPPAVEAA